MNFLFKKNFNNIVLIVIEILTSTDRRVLFPGDSPSI